MKQNQYYLLDSEQMHEDYPGTFEIPSLEEVAAITVGSCVELLFVGNERAPERVRVIVESINEDELIGHLDGELIGIPISNGDIISFGRKHICQLFPTRRLLVIQYREVRREFVVDVPAGIDLDDEDDLRQLSEEADDRGVDWIKNDDDDLGEMQVAELGKNWLPPKEQVGMIDVPFFVSASTGI